MNTPSKEALEAAENVQDYLGFPRRATMDLAAIIDRHFAPLRQRAEQAEARVKVWETELSSVMPADFKDWHQNAKSEWPAVAAAVVRNLQAHVKELEASNSRLVKSLAAYGKYAYTEDRDIDAIRAANEDLKKQEAESRRLFYEEQDKRQAAQFRCEELAGALREAQEIAQSAPELNMCNYDHDDVRALNEAMIEVWEVLKHVLARHAAGEPAGLRTDDPLTDGNTLGGLPRHVGDKLGEPDPFPQRSDPRFRGTDYKSRTEPAKRPEMSRHAQPFCGD